MKRTLHEREQAAIIAKCVEALARGAELVRLELPGRFDEGLAEIKRARELDPLSLIMSTDEGKIYFMARQYDRTIEQCHKTLEMDPNFTIAHVRLGFAYSAKGRHEEAIAEFHKLKDLSEDPYYLFSLGYVYGMAGQRDEAQRVLRRLTALSRQTHVPAIGWVMVYVALGEKDQAFNWIDRVFDEHTNGVLDLKVSPGFDRLRSDPRYDALLRRAGFSRTS